MGNQPGGVFLVSGSQSTAEHLAAMLPAGMFTAVHYALSASEARRRVGESDCGLVIINAPLSDETGLQLARDLAARYPVGILLLAKADRYEQLANAAEAEGIVTLAKPVNRQTLAMTVHLLAATAVRLRTYARQTAALRLRMEDIRLVNRAKGVLMERLHMTEAEAHRYLEKQAMDLCQKRRDVAEQILRTYEDTC